MTRSIEKSNDLIWNETHDLPACRIVPQPACCKPVVFQLNFLCNKYFKIQKIIYSKINFISKLQVDAALNTAAICVYLAEC
jgi:hypothetical protein